MKTIISFFITSILLIQLAHSQEIELIGMGVENVNPSTLFISNPFSVDSVVVEATATYVTFLGEPDPSNVSFSDANESYEVGFNMVEQDFIPSWVGSHKDVYFRATFYDVDAEGITLNNFGQEEYISSFTAYVYRKNIDSNVYSNVVYDHASIWRNTAANPMIYNFEVPETEQSREIQVEIPITELSGDGRYGMMIFAAGTDTVSVEFDSNNMGELLNIQTITLPNVPGNTTDISLKIYSPIEEIDGKIGDSFITGPILISSMTNKCGKCKGQITYLELEYIGNKTNATVRIYSDKLHHNNLIKVFKNVNNGNVLNFSGVGKFNKMGDRIRIIVDNKDCTEINTSCSQEIYAGMTFDNQFLIIYGTSHEGGELCYKEINVETEKKNNKNCNKKKDKKPLKNSKIITNVTCSPNPVQTTTAITFTSSICGKAKVCIFNSRGKNKGTLYNKNIKSNDPVNIHLDSNRFKKGIYLVVINVGAHKKSFEILINK